ncbi:hypothetical protein BH23THE1_BH23THE1_29570 [soil metagenome]
MILFWSGPSPKVVIKRGYILHIPIKKKKKKKGGEDSEEKVEEKPNLIVRNILPRDGLSSVLIRGITDSGNFSQGMKRRMKTILGWYSFLAVS